MHDLLFSVFPNENFVDLSLYQFGWERCEPSLPSGPASRNHYLFHYVSPAPEPSMPTTRAGVTHTYRSKAARDL